MNAWFPSRYGPDDQAGALNEITPDGVVAAARLVRNGRVFDLAWGKPREYDTLDDIRAQE